MLIESGADVNSIDRGGLIPLHNAASYGHIEIAQLLLDAGSQVNANDRWQFTPLHEGNIFLRLPYSAFFSAQNLNRILWFFYFSCSKRPNSTVCPASESRFKSIC